MNLKRRLVGPAGETARGERVRLLLAQLGGAWRVTAHAVWRAARALASPGALVVLMLMAGGSCAVTGVWMLVGTPWALLTAAAILFTLAALALRGMLHG